MVIAQPHIHIFLGCWVGIDVPCFGNAPADIVPSIPIENIVFC